MPRNETVLNVFLASPSDVQEEREIVDEVIRELNQIWSRNLNLRLDLIRWETHTYPQFAAYPQDAINSQINDNYDIFIGILWSRLGTPTREALSGTLEEFYQAYKKYINDNNSVELMIYFKDDPIPPSLIDIEQFSKIQDFKSKIGELGGYYNSFKSNDFSSQLRTHLSAIAQKWATKLSKPDQNLESKLEPLYNNPLNNDEEDENEDLGIYDYIQIYTDSMSQSTNQINNINFQIELIGKQANHYANQFNNYLSDNDKKATVHQVSKDLTEFAKNIDISIEFYIQYINQSFEAYSKFLSLYVDIKNYDNDIWLEELTSVFDTTLQSAQTCLEAIIGLQKSVVALPRLTVELNKSKKLVIKSLNGFIVELNDTIKSLKDIIAKSRSL